MIRFDVDGKRFVSDPLDGETIVMDTVSGRLFLLEQGAAVLWDSITRGASRDALIAAVQSRGGAVREAQDFLDRLLALGLASEAAVDDATELPDTTGQWPADLGAFLLTQYDDMTSIITMDPIHDIDPQRGWPFDGRD